MKTHVHENKKASYFCKDYGNAKKGFNKIKTATYIIIIKDMYLVDEFCYNYTLSVIMSNHNSLLPFATLFPLPVSSSSTFSLHIFTRNESWKTITNK